MADTDREKRREALWKKCEEIDALLPGPCIACGRVVLAGFCCDLSREMARAKSNSEVRRVAVQRGLDPSACVKRYGKERTE